MKKVFVIGMMAFGAIFSTNLVNAQAVEQGNIIIDPYYGFPNFGKKLADGLGATDVKIVGIGPMGLRAEYMVADKFGIGVDFIFNTLSLTFKADSIRPDGSTIQYDVKTAMNRYRVHARFNYHFIDNDNVDAYFGLGAGTNTRIWKLETDYPNYSDDNTSGTFLPVSMRVCMGARYYFTDNIGLNGEIGVGGPMLSLGLSVKL